MGWEQLPPEVPTWSTGITTEDQNEIKRLEAQVAALKEDLADMFNVGPVCLECQRKDEHIKALEDALFSKGAMFDTPCFCCGYNGPHYFDPRIHGCALRHHALAKAMEAK
jgi:hypothetical protein